jgi:hypothetical protein
MGLLQQEELTGDWRGLRMRRKDKDVVFAARSRSSIRVSGGTETGSEYNATAQATLEFDFGKLTGCLHGRRLGNNLGTIRPKHQGKWGG